MKFNPFTSDGHHHRPSSHPVGHLRPFRTALHLSGSLADAAIPTSFRYLSLHSSSRSFVAYQVFLCLLIPRSVQFWRCYCRLSAGCVQPIFVSLFLSSQSVAACWSGFTVPHLRFGLANKLSGSFSYISCKRHPVCSYL